MKKIKILSVVLAFVIVFAFASTAFAAQFTANWSSSTCLTGFTTSDRVEKDANETWVHTVVYVDKLIFASTPTYNYLRATPRTSGGSTMGPRMAVSLSDPEMIAINDYETHNYIKLRIDNPNSNNNMNSKGHWEGYVAP